LLGIDGEAKTLFIDEAKAGLYFEPENEQALADAVLFMSQNADESMKLGKRGREYVSENFERNKIALALSRKLDDIHKNQTR
jgi:glycosyltransferase involved in cell wall biosynthesis